MRLLESQAKGERRRGGIALSVVAHVVVVAGAVAASATVGRSTVAPPTPIDVVYRAPLVDAPPGAPKRSDGRGDAGRVDPAPVTRGAEPPTLPLPGDPIAGIPPIGTGPVIDPARLGGLGDASRGGSGGGAMGGAAGDGVWDVHVVEVPAAPLAGNPVPRYPDALRAGGVGGRVLAEFVVDTTGHVRPGSIVVVESAHELFALAVRRTIPALRFAPARAQGRLVAQRVRMPFEFEVR